jgi:DNA-binding response OmpR family regulator
LFGPTPIPDDRTVDSHIKKLRKKIQAVDPRAELIQSVYGVGYKLDEAVLRLE